MSTEPTNTTEATSLVAYALDCLTQRDFPPADQPVPFFERVATIPVDGMIAVQLPNGDGIIITVAFHEAARDRLVPFTWPKPDAKEPF